MTQRIINEYKSRPANPRQYDTSEQIGKPLSYLFFSLIAIGTGMTLTIIHANRIYQCAAYFWNEWMLGIGIGLMVAGFVSVVFLAISLLRREYPLIEEEREYQEPEREPSRLVRVQSSHAPGVLEMSDRGREIGGVFFPHRVLRMLVSLKRWPSRKGFWEKKSVWEGTKEQRWHGDLYTENTQKLKKAGIIEDHGTGFKWTEYGLEELKK